jgi:stage III sporulation protein AE
MFAIFALMMALIVLLIAACSDEADAGSNDAVPDDTSSLVERQAESGGIDRIKNELEKYTDEDVMDLLGGYDADTIIGDLLKGNLDIDMKGVGTRALKFLFREMYQNIGILIKIAVLVIICALLKNLQTGFMSEGAGQIAFYVCYIVIVSILFVSYGTVMNMGIGIIDSMVGFMYAMIPVMLALLVSGGNITAGGILHPVLLLIVETAATIIRNVFVPLICVSTVLTIINNISEKVQLTRLVNLIRQIVSWSLGIILTIFIIAVTMQGSLGAVIDGATQKAAKFAISTFIPIVGKTLSDAADTVIGCTLLIKNAAGVAAMIGILVICVLPLLKIIALVGLFKAAGALLEPISESRITNCINEVAGSMLHILALSAAVAFMFIVCVAALISAGNLSAMLR